MQDKLNPSSKQVTYSGRVAGFNMKIYGYIKSQERVCKNCVKMSQNNAPLVNDRLRLPCQYANKQLDGHWFKFTPELEQMYENFRARNR